MTLTKNLPMALKRFPLSCFCLLIIFIAIIFYDRIDFYLPIIPILTFSAWGFFLFGSLDLFFENTNLKKFWYFISQGLAIFILLLLAFFLAQTNIYGTLFLLLSFFLLALIAPSLNWKKDHHSNWLLDFKYPENILLSFFFGVLLAIGLTLILLALGLLWPSSASFFKDLILKAWLVSTTVISPLMILCIVPQQKTLSLEKEPLMLIKLLKYLIFPLLIVYTIIIYLYGLKILITQIWPEGIIVSITAIFGLFTVSTYFLIWIISFQENFKKPWLWKHFTKFLLVPLILMALALKLRVSEYGLTEARCALIIIFLWLLSFTILSSFNFKRNPTIIISILIVFLMLASFGPLGVSNISNLSQLNRLKIILSENNLLNENDEIFALELKPPLSFESINQLQSLRSYFSEENRRDFLNKKLKFSKDPNNTIEKLDSLFYVTIETSKDKNVNSTRDKNVRFTGLSHNYIFPLNNYDYLIDFKEENISNLIKIRLHPEENNLQTIIFDDNNIILDEFNLDLSYELKNNSFFKEKINEIKEEKSYYYHTLSDFIVLEKENENFKLKFMFQEIVLEMDENMSIKKIKSCQGILLIKDNNNLLNW